MPNSLIQYYTSIPDLCEDMQTRQVILTLQQTEQARRRKTNVRDSRRRRSIRRNKFESPQQATTSHENNFMRGGVRGSLRQKEMGEQISKKEMKEERDNMTRTLSKEDVNQFVSLGNKYSSTLTSTFAERSVFDPRRSAECSGQEQGLAEQAPPWQGPA